VTARAPSQRALFFTCLRTLTMARAALLSVCLSCMALPATTMSGPPTLRVDPGRNLAAQLDFSMFTDKIGELNRVYRFEALGDSLTLYHLNKVRPRRNGRRHYTTSLDVHVYFNTSSFSVLTHSPTRFSNAALTHISHTQNTHLGPLVRLYTPPHCFSRPRHPAPNSCSPFPPAALPLF
jgi:hypothetical protein